MTEWINVNDVLKIRIERQLVQFSKEGKHYNFFTDDFLNFVKKDEGSVSIPEVTGKGYLLLNREILVDYSYYYSIYEKILEDFLKQYPKKNLKKQINKISKGSTKNSQKYNKFLYYGYDDEDEEESEIDYSKDLGDYNLNLYR